MNIWKKANGKKSLNYHPSAIMIHLIGWHEPKLVNFSLFFSEGIPDGFESDELSG